MATLGTPDDPIDNLDVDAALSHWAEGTGDDVYLDMRSHLSTDWGKRFYGGKIRGSSCKPSC
jgi:hypothetical protein